jgi:hypothetical protein
MSVDASQITQPAPQQFSPLSGQVAPPAQGQQPASGPGAVPQQPQSQPAQQPQQTVAPEAPASPPQIDPAILAERQRLQQLEAQNRQYQQFVDQLQRAAQENQQNQQFNQNVQMMLARAEAMPQQEANAFLRDQIQSVIAQERLRAQQEVQQVRQQADQQIRMVTAPQYADYLLKQLQLPEEAREELLALGDPDTMLRYAPQVKARHDRYQQQLAQFQNSQVQVARSQEVQAMQNAGLGAFGGQDGGSFQVEIPDHLSADEKAMLIYEYTNGLRPAPTP